MKFGDNLKQIRKSKNISQEELAEKLGVSRQSVSKWETGENYPSMYNIMCLCDIFKCKINNLVHESMSDINSLDEEVKMSVVKFKEEKQKKVKVLSKIISVVSKIGKVCCIIGIVVAAMCAIIVPVLMNNIRIKDNEIVFKNDTVTIADEDDELVVKVKNSIIATIDDERSVDIIRDIAKNDINNKTLVITYTELGIVFLIATLYLTILLLKHLDKLFTNINQGDTPFTLENVDHIKKIAYLMIVLIVIPSISAVFFEFIVKRDLNIRFETFSILEILIIFVIAYIFEYGYEIQLDSKGTMYGKEE